MGTNLVDWQIYWKGRLGAFFHSLNFEALRTISIQAKQWYSEVVYKLSKGYKRREDQPTSEFFDVGKVYLIKCVGNKYINFNGVKFVVPIVVNKKGSECTVVDLTYVDRPRKIWILDKLLTSHQEINTKTVAQIVKTARLDKKAVLQLTSKEIQTPCRCIEVGYYPYVIEI